MTWQPVTTGIAADAIMLNPVETRQEMLGFGAAFTDAACYMLNQLPPDNRATMMHELFAPDQMALSVCRTCIGASDYSKSLYSFDDSEQDDPELKNFSIDHDKRASFLCLGKHASSIRTFSFFPPRGVRRRG